jgi:hypothetical protein
MGQASLNAPSQDIAQTRLHRDLIRRPDFRVREGMVIADLEVCDIRDEHEWKWRNDTVHACLLACLLARLRVCCMPVCRDYDWKHRMEAHSAIAMGRFTSLRTEILIRSSRVLKNRSILSFVSTVRRFSEIGLAYLILRRY